MIKKDLMVLFSGGRTSAFMGWWLKKYMSHIFNLHFVYANTGHVTPNPEHKEHRTFFREKYSTMDILNMALNEDFKYFEDPNFEDCAEECGSVIPFYEDGEE